VEISWKLSSDLCKFTFALELNCLKRLIFMVYSRVMGDFSFGFSGVGSIRNVLSNEFSSTEIMFVISVSALNYEGLV
jgi:hypothetical protein